VRSPLDTCVSDGSLASSTPFASVEATRSCARSRWHDRGPPRLSLPHGLISVETKISAHSCARGRLEEASTPPSRSRCGVMTTGCNARSRGVPIDANSFSDRRMSLACDHREQAPEATTVACTTCPRRSPSGFGDHEPRARAEAQFFETRLSNSWGTTPERRRTPSPGMGESR
jgi:hypothetical protein